MRPPTASQVITVLVALFMLALAAAVGAMLWHQRSVLADQQEVVARLQTQAQARAVEMQELHDGMLDLKDEIREEIRTPAGERAETHEAARRAEAELQEALRLLAELCEATDGCEP